MTGWLLAVSIGPVQEFIAAARKTQDLWYGSELLSDLARTAATSIRDEGGELIFPHPDLLTKQDAAVANKLLVLFPATKNKTADDIADISTKAKRTAVDYLRNLLLTSVKNRAGKEGVEGDVDWDLAEAQVEHFLEYAAAWVPYDERSSDGYEPARERVEHLLAGRKALRDFEPADVPVPRAPFRDKSALDPSREGVVRTETLRDDPDRWEKVRPALRLRGNESLDGISLIKRLGEHQHFVSVARVVADPFIRRLAAEQQPHLAKLRCLAARLAGVNEIDRFEVKGTRLDQYANFPYDTILFHDEEGARDQDIVAKTSKDLAADFRMAVSAAKSALGGVEIPRYVAVLAADGDRMGKLVSTIARAGPTAHRTMSLGLVRFAERANEVVTDHSGASVYSGGDDVLAFLPLDTALPCAEALRQAFQETMEAIQSHEEVRALLADQPLPTLSVGLAIGHFGSHMQDLLQRGRDAERAAKNCVRKEKQKAKDTACAGDSGSEGRDDTPAEFKANALAVSFHSRSGGDGRMVVTGWEQDPVNTLWASWTAWNCSAALSDKTGYRLWQLADEFRPIVTGTSPGYDVADVLKRETRRILERRREGGGEHPVSDEVIEDLVRQIHDLPSLQDVANGLIISRRVARAIDAAGHASIESHWSAVAELLPKPEAARDEAGPEEEQEEVRA